jgi:predicted AAA+ superfamily ATPase
MAPLNRCYSHSSCFACLGHSNPWKRDVHETRHSLLNIQSVNDLLGHPSTGASWEGFVIEHIAAQLPPGATLSFYRTAAGAEMDAVVELGQARMGFEVKFSSAPKVTKGFWQAREDLQLTHTCIVAPVAEGWPVQEGVSVMGVAEIPAALARLG